MKTVRLQQGTPEWADHRAQHFNASEAPAMLGCSPYKTRADLIRERATGITPEVDAATQRRFNDGHRFESLARSAAEIIIGEELYPCTGVLEGTKLSASFDGLTMLGDVAWEHKSLNDELRKIVNGETTGAELPEHYRVQMEQQCLVSGAERVLFMATKWDADGNMVEERQCWYTPDPALRARIVAGWEQFEKDVAAYVPEPVKSEVVAAPVEGFGALSLRVEGRVLASNLDAFKADADAFIARLPKPADLQTDQDFADAEAAVKACSEAETRIKAATDAALAQMSDVDAVLRAAGAVAETIRAARLALDKAVKVEKENRKAALVRAAQDDVIAHYTAINATLGEHSLGITASLGAELGAAIKGKRTIASIRDALDTAAAAAKIDASQRADRIRASIAVLAEFADHAHLFADRVALCHDKAPDDLRNLAAARIAEHQKREAERLDAEREWIRQEEANKLPEQNTTRAVEVEQQSPAAGGGMGDLTGELRAAGEPGIGIAKPPNPTHLRLKLGDINAAIAPLSVTADGLAQLGIKSCGTDRAAKLYDTPFEDIRDALIARLMGATIETRKAA
jgi:putative phage-type endonuclease